MKKLVAVLLAIIVAFIAVPAFAQTNIVQGDAAVKTPDSAPPSPFKILEGPWAGYSDSNAVTLTLGAFSEGTPKSVVYTFRGRPVKIVSATAVKDGEQIKLEIQAATGLRISVNYYTNDNGMLTGKAKPSGGAQEYDIRFYREKK